MDSNKKYLNPRKLWTIKGTSWNFCPHIKNIREIINEEKSQGFDTVLISCGTNDIEYKSGIEVHTELMSVIKFINEKYPTLKIIISHITPRKDDLNKEVLGCLVGPKCKPIRTRVPS